MNRAAIELLDSMMIVTAHVPTCNAISSNRFEKQLFVASIALLALESLVDEEGPPKVLPSSRFVL